MKKLISLALAALLLLNLAACGESSVSNPSDSSGDSSSSADPAQPDAFSPVTTEAEVRALYGDDASLITSIEAYQGDFLVKLGTDEDCPSLDWVYGQSGIRRRLLWLDEPLICSVKKRLPWLLALLALGVVVSGVVGLFEAVAAQITLVVCFQSLVLDMAGNVGTQSLAVTIRVLMDEQLSRGQKLQLVWKEARVGFINGLLLGTASFLVIGGYLCLLRGQPPVMGFGVSLCIGIALIVSMVLSSIAGTVIPIFFKAIHVDPAVASGPLITTVNDLVAVVAYYGSVWLLLLQILNL